MTGFYIRATLALNGLKLIIKKIKGRLSMKNVSFGKIVEANVYKVDIQINISFMSEFRNKSKRITSVNVLSETSLLTSRYFLEVF